MDGFSIAGGGSLRPRHEALAAQRYEQALTLFRVPIGLADPQDLGSGVIEHGTRSLMVGSFRLPPPPPPPSLGADRHCKISWGSRRERMGGRGMRGGIY